MSTTNRHTVRPGFTLQWGAGGFELTSFADLAQVGFIFSLSDDAREFPASQMLCAANPADMPLHDAALTPSFHAAVILSAEGFGALLGSDESRGARRLREIATGEIFSLYALPLTAGARFAVESIRRCPFAGVCREMALAARCNDLLVEFLTAIAAAETPSQLPVTRGVHDRVQLAAEALKRALEHPPALPALARQVGLSETTLKRGFHQVFGTTVFGYLRARRMERAHALLQSGEATVLEAAALVGYSNPSNFAATFRRHFGVNPKTFQLAVRR